MAGVGPTCARAMGERSMPRLASQGLVEEKIPWAQRQPLAIRVGIFQILQAHNLEGGDVARTCMYSDGGDAGSAVFLALLHAVVHLHLHEPLSGELHTIVDAVTSPYVTGGHREA